MNIEGKVVFITGGAGDIGRAMTRLFAKEDSKVTQAVRNLAEFLQRRGG